MAPGEDGNDGAQKASMPTWLEFLRRPRHLQTIAKYCPLVSAILAPLATLLDIPALTQHWYTFEGIPQSDPAPCLALSAVGLGFNIIANGLLLLRFSSLTSWWWRHATTWSLLCWNIKTITAAINLLVFGILTRNIPGYSYDAGFWCAVVSIIDSGVISICLTIHWFFVFRASDDSANVRYEGKQFMLSVTFFLAILAIQAVAFWRLEGWAYNDAIYFSVQTALTIGFGDLTPTTTAGKVLIFPFAILTISQLGNEIALILGFISARADERKEQWRRKYEQAVHDEANRRKPNAGLVEEMALIHRINQREETMSQMYDLVWSASALVIFWLFGAGMFSAIEGWDYGNGLYSVMILTLTIGFGDFAPVTPAGRVVFIPYALMAVPIVTSFAGQTITGLLSSFRTQRDDKQAFLRAQDEKPEAFQSHTDHILKVSESYGEMRSRLFDLPVPKNFRPPAEADVSDAAASPKTSRFGIRGIREKGHEGGSGTGSHGGNRTGSASQLVLPPLGAARASGSSRTLRVDHSDVSKVGAGEQVQEEEHWTDAEKRLRRQWQHVKWTVDERKAREEAQITADLADCAVRHADEMANHRSGRSDSDDHLRTDDMGVARQTMEQGTRDAIAGQNSISGSEYQDGITQGIGNNPSDDALVHNEGLDENDDADTAENSALGEIISREEKWEEDLRQGKPMSGRALELELFKDIITLTVIMEAEARQMLLDSMPHSVARTLLLADRNVQIRDVLAITGGQAKTLDYWKPQGGTGTSPSAGNVASAHGKKSDRAMLSSVRRYRNIFARILVLSAMLQKLEGEDLLEFQRTRTAGDMVVDHEEEQERLKRQEGNMRPDDPRQRDLDELLDDRMLGLNGRVWESLKARLTRKERADRKYQQEA